jgi:hypothetical protein
MSWIDSILNKGKTKTLRVKLIKTTDKAIKIMYADGLITYLPKKETKVIPIIDTDMIEITIPLWLYRKNFI